MIIILNIFRLNTEINGQRYMDKKARLNYMLCTRDTF